MRVASGSGRTMYSGMYYCSLAVLIITFTTCNHVVAGQHCDALHTEHCLS